MSATFLSVKGGGWVNAAHIREIDEFGVATIGTDEPSVDRYYQLEDEWERAENAIELKGIHHG